MGPRLETPRLVLRPPQLTDLNDYLAVRNSLYVLRFNAMGAASRAKTEEELFQDRQSRRAFFLEERAGGALVGAVWLAEDTLRPQAGAVALEYFLGEEYASRGYMTEALGALLPYAFWVLGAQVVSARVMAGNAASQRVLEKLGFRREGLLRRAVKAYGGVVRDDMPYSLLREEWEEGRGQ